LKLGKVLSLHRTIQFAGGKKKTDNNYFALNQIGIKMYSLTVLIKNIYIRD